MRSLDAWLRARASLRAGSGNYRNKELRRTPGKYASEPSAHLSLRTLRKLGVEAV